jgi:hypothetical protein
MSRQYNNKRHVRNSFVLVKNLLCQVHTCNIITEGKIKHDLPVIINHLMQNLNGIPGVKQPGCGVDHPPPSSTKVEERAQLYFCSASVHSYGELYFF